MKILQLRAVCILVQITAVNAQKEGNLVHEQQRKIKQFVTKYFLTVLRHEDNLIMRI